MFLLVFLFVFLFVFRFVLLALVLLQLHERLLVYLLGRMVVRGKDLTGGSPFLAGLTPEKGSHFLA